MSQPTPKFQIQFLKNLQRLLAEGRFTASYKFALSLALADVAVERGDDSGVAMADELTWEQGRTMVPLSGNWERTLRELIERAA